MYSMPLEIYDGVASIEDWGALRMFILDLSISKLICRIEDFFILYDKIPIYAHCVMLRFQNPFMDRVWRLEMTDTSQNGALLQWTTSGWLWVLGASTTRSIASLLLKDKLLKCSVVMKCRQVGTGAKFLEPDCSTLLNFLSTRRFSSNQHPTLIQLTFDLHILIN